MKRATRLSSLAIAGFVLASWSAWAPAAPPVDPGQTQPGQTQPEEQGPVAKAPATAGQSSSQNPSDSRGYMTATEPAGIRSGGGAPLGAFVGGSLETAREQADRRIKRLIKRLG